MIKIITQLFDTANAYKCYHSPSKSTSETSLMLTKPTARRVRSSTSPTTYHPSIFPSKTNLYLDKTNPNRYTPMNSPFPTKIHLWTIPTIMKPASAACASKHKSTTQNPSWKRTTKITTRPNDDANACISVLLDSNVDRRVKSARYVAARRAHGILVDGMPAARSHLATLRSSKFRYIVSLVTGLVGVVSAMLWS